MKQLHAHAPILAISVVIYLVFVIAQPARGQNSTGAAATATAGTATDACNNVSAQRCAEMAIDAMGGRERLDSLKTIRTETVAHTFLMEQSYRQDPFITSYQRRHETLDLAGRRLYRESDTTWPESDVGKSESHSTLVIGDHGGVYRTKTADRPCSVGDIDELHETLELGPARLLMTAIKSSDLHFEKSEMLRSTMHFVLAFTWNKIPTAILINSSNHLPDAVETIQSFDDFWNYWGDVRQKIYFDNWMLIHGIVFPTNTVEERNGAVWQSKQAVNVEFNVPVDEKQFVMDEKATQQSTRSNFLAMAFRANSAKALAPGVDLFLGPWNATIIQQEDGIVILESPMSGIYTQGVIDQAKQMHPNAQIKAVLSTSDSWPHVAGVRQAIADGLPVFILDLNQALLDRFVNEPRTIDPDALSQSPKKPDWKIVSGKTIIGSGENRVELYPLRGAGTERQYMVYFPGHKILYASDTLVINRDGSLYDPELTYEVVQAAKREHLEVTTVFAMHQEPVPWSQVLGLIEKADQPAAEKNSEGSGNPQS